MLDVCAQAPTARLSEAEGRSSVKQAAVAAPSRAWALFGGGGGGGGG
jgi:hypothetical protein